jgi:hypothetical protein
MLNRETPFEQHNDQMKTNSELSSIFPSVYSRKCDLPESDRKAIKDSIFQKYREEVMDAVRCEDANVLLDYSIIYYQPDEPQMVIFYCVSCAEHVWVKYCIRDLLDDCPDDHDGYDDKANHDVARELWENGNFKTLTRGLVKGDLTHALHCDISFLKRQ